MLVPPGCAIRGKKKFNSSDVSDGSITGLTAPIGTSGRAAAERGAAFPSFARAQAILNLGMLFSTKCNVRINLRSMVRSISLPTSLSKPISTKVPYRRRCRNICMFKPACLTIAVSSTTNLGIDMSKPRLQLIHCSNDIRPRAKHRQHGRSFRPLVIHGGARARSVPTESSWEAALKLIDLGLLISHVNYLAFLQASKIVLEAHNWTDPEKTS